MSKPPSDVGSADPVEFGLAPQASVRDYWTLMKPNVMQLAVFTGAVGLYLAPERVHPLIAVTAILCMAVGAGACGAINNWFDADIDQSMGRTKSRPTVTGKIVPADALAFGVTLSILSVMLLGLSTNWLAASLLALTIAFYVVVYTVWLKRRTPQNIVIGGAAGALPPIIGWAAATGAVGLAPLIMFAIIFLWTPPHFWALAVAKSEEYRRVDVPMLPVVQGRARTCAAIVGYSIALSIAALMLSATSSVGWVYLAAALVLSARLVYLSLRILGSTDDAPAWRLFRFSIFYLFGLFLSMVVDRIVVNSSTGLVS